MTTTENKKFTLDLALLGVGNVLSESSHYIVRAIEGKSIQMHHLETNKEVYLDASYVQDILSSADQFGEEITVGREDKLWTANQIAKMEWKGILSVAPRVGDMKLLGIRSLFEQIYTNEVFTVCFVKQDKPLSNKKYNELLMEQIGAAVNAIETTAANKKGVATEAEAQIRKIIANPVLPYEPGEDRILRGFKIQFTSRDGRYDCIDMDIDLGKEETNVRPVNINTIKWLIYRGVKYVVEK